jgi:hypothetical protein
MLLLECGNVAMGDGNGSSGGLPPQTFTYLISNVLCGGAIFWLRGEIPHWLAPFGYIP